MGAGTAKIAGYAPTSGLLLVVLTPNLSLTFGGNFSDPGALDSHTATWTFGDGSTSTTNFGAGGALVFAVMTGCVLMLLFARASREAAAV